MHSWVACKRSPCSLLPLALLWMRHCHCCHRQRVSQQLGLVEEGQQCPEAVAEEGAGLVPEDPEHNVPM